MDIELCAYVHALLVYPATDDGAEELPLLTLQTHHLHLLNRVQICRRGIRNHTRNHQFEGHLVKVRSLLHHVGSR